MSAFRHPGTWGILLAVVASVILAQFEFAWTALWPSGVALLVVFLSRSALIGLLTGAVCGAILLSGGISLGFFQQLIGRQLFPVFLSEWQISAMLFTLILGGFVALVEAGAGLHALVRLLLGSGKAPAKRMQFTVVGFGLLIFFDGLANTMLIGRLFRSTADRCGVSREKLAYIADATGSAVACVAFISTWIAFQLSMIKEGFAIAGESVNAYSLFFQSLPTNFYSWFTLVMVAFCILFEFNPGSMGRIERAARKRALTSADEVATSPEETSHWLLAIVPIAVLTLSIPVLTYLIGAEVWWPITFARFAEAYGAAEAYVPQILVASSLVASLVAGIAIKRSRKGVKSPATKPIFPIFLGGVKDLIIPVCILIAAWMLGSAISQLGAATLLAELLQGRVGLTTMPLAVFGTGALIAFSTGTSWGTMGVLMPLAIPVIFSLSGEAPDAERDRILVAAVGAVFSGAVLGDHCSPFSDTTIVASIASGVEPLDHVRTQLPFAAITALVAAICGFLPLGFGISVWWCLLGGIAVLLGLVLLFTKKKPNSVAASA